MGNIMENDNQHQNSLVSIGSANSLIKKQRIPSIKRIAIEH